MFRKVLGIMSELQKVYCYLGNKESNNNKKIFFHIKYSGFLKYILLLGNTESPLSLNLQRKYTLCHNN